MISKKQKQILFVLGWIDALLVFVSLMLGLVTNTKEILNFAMLLVLGNLAFFVVVLIIFLIYISYHFQFNSD